jgi:hypothetical protein
MESSKTSILLLKKTQKVRLWYMIVVSEIVDIIWIAFWGSLWNSADFANNNNTGVTSFTLVISIINLIIKVRDLK